MGPRRVSEVGAPAGLQRRVPSPCSVASGGLVAAPDRRASTRHSVPWCDSRDRRVASAGIDTRTLIGLTCCEGNTCGSGGGARVLSWEPGALGTPLGDTSSWGRSLRGCSLRGAAHCHRVSSARVLRLAVLRFWDLVLQVSFGLIVT